MAFHAIKAGEGDAFVSAGVECVSRYPAFTGAGAGDEAFVNPLFAEARARTDATAASNETWHDPRAGRAAARRLHLDGPDRRERGHLAGHHP